VRAGGHRLRPIIPALARWERAQAPGSASYLKAPTLMSPGGGRRGWGRRIADTAGQETRQSDRGDKSDPTRCNSMPIRRELVPIVDWTRCVTCGKGRGVYGAWGILKRGFYTLTHSMIIGKIWLPTRLWVLRQGAYAGLRRYVGGSALGPSLWGYYTLIRLFALIGGRGPHRAGPLTPVCRE
jgi:hypothetical protein